jgi:hypothetical protein
VAVVQAISGQADPYCDLLPLNKIFTHHQKRSFVKRA